MKILVPMAHFFPVKHLYKLAELVQQDHGLDLIDSWERQGFTLPEDHSEFVQAQDFIAACKLAVDEVSDPILGLKFGHTLTLINMGPLGAAMMSCATLSESIHLALDFSNGYIPHPFTMKEKGGYLHISSSAHITQDAYSKFDFQVFAMALIQYIRELSKTDPKAIRVDFCFPKPDQNLYQRYQEYLSVKISFNQESSAIIIPTDLVNEPLPGRDDVSKASFIDICESTQLKLAAREGLSHQIFTLLDSSENYPSLETLAQMLNISARTLRYQLDKEDTNYRKVLAQHRLIRATDLLQRSDLPIKSISEKVGYHDLPSFYRIFKKEMGSTPAQWRAKSR